MTTISTPVPIESVDNADRRMTQVLDELQQVDAELAAAGQALLNYFRSHPELKIVIVKVGAYMPTDPGDRAEELRLLRAGLTRLELERNRIIARRNSLLSEYATLKIQKVQHVG